MTNYRHILSMCAKKKMDLQSPSNINGTVLEVAQVGTKRSHSYSIDVLIMVSTLDEERAITKNESFLEGKLENGIQFLYKTEGGLNIALGRGYSYGETPAALMTQALYDKLHPSYLGLAGFCAGKFSAQTLGDLVIAEHVFKYDMGKQVSKNKTAPEMSSYKLDPQTKRLIEMFGDTWRESFKLTPPKDFQLQCIEFLTEMSTHAEGVDPRTFYDRRKYPCWKGVIQELIMNKYISKISNKNSFELTSSGADYLYGIQVEYADDYSPTLPKTMLGRMATGAKVQQWDGIFAKLNSEFERKCTVLDMEGHALGAAAEFNSCPVIIAKGVGDFARAGKNRDNEAFVEFAVYSSFRFLVEFFKKNLYVKDIQHCSPPLVKDAERKKYYNRKNCNGNKNLPLISQEKDRTDVLEEIWAFSGKHIKEQAYVMIGTSTQEIINISRSQAQSLLQRVNAFVSNKDRWECFDRLLANTISIKRILGQGVQSETIKRREDLLEYLSELVCKDSNTIPLILKGNPTLGKSTFATVWFFYLLSKFSNEKFEYIPVYFNFETIRKSNDSQKENGITPMDEFDAFLMIANELTSKFSLPHLLIIDGLSELEIYNNKAEQHVMQCISEKYLSKTDQLNRIIYVIDDYQIKGQAKTAIGQNEKIDYIVYFNKILGINIKHEEDRIAEFIKNYGKLLGCSEANINQGITNYNAFQLPDITVNFLASFKEDIYFSNTILDLPTLYLRYFESKFPTRAEKESAIAVAYSIYSDDAPSYMKMQEMYNGLTLRTFEILIEQRGLLQYLVAKQYVDELKEFDANRKIPQVLNMLCNKNIALYITSIITALNLKTIICTKIKQAYDHLSIKGKSALSYLIGRLEIDENDAISILDKQLTLLEKYNDKNDIDYSIALRSIKLSNIVARKGNTWFEYFNTLLSDSAQCIINRAVCRFYYEENYPAEPILLDPITRGFDFYMPFHNLATHIQRYVRTGEKYPLLEIELFTLCNFFQTRLECPFCTDKPKEKTLLYNSNYLDDARIYLSKLVDWINYYLVHNRGLRENQLFLYSMYLVMMRDIFSNYLSTEKEEIQISPAVEYYNKEQNLFTFSRIGWNIATEDDELSEQQILEARALPPLETIGDHILGTYLLGQIFLPERTMPDFKNMDGYDKETILKAVLIHDLGEAETNDYPPQYAEITKIKKREDNYNSHLFLLGTFNDAGSLLELYKIWEQLIPEHCDDINIKIAKELDKIQMLYKYYQLRANGKLEHFSQSRHLQFEQEAGYIATSLGKHILKKAVLENPIFKITSIEAATENQSPC